MNDSYSMRAVFVIWSSVGSAGSLIYKLPCATILQVTQLQIPHFHLLFPFLRKHMPASQSGVFLVDAG